MAEGSETEQGQAGGPLVVVTGMTGAGRSTAAKELEDLGYYVVDNLPPSLLRDVVRLVDESRGPQQPIAVVVDVRSGSFFGTLQANLAHGATGRRATLVFLEATDEVLVRLTATGLCHSDEHLVTGDLPIPLPVVGGHEGAGTVAAVGPGAQEPACCGEQAGAGADVGDHQDRGEEGDDGCQPAYGVAGLLERDQPRGQCSGRGADRDQGLHPAGGVAVRRHEQRQQGRHGHHLRCHLGHRVGGEGRHARNLRHL